MANLQLAHQVNYLFDFVKQDGARYFIAGDRANLYLLNRAVNPLTTDPVSTLTVLNASPFTGGDNDRWQSATFSDSLYIDYMLLVNITTRPVVFVDNATPIALLGGATPDAFMPIGAKYIINAVNHVILANTIEADGAHPNRVRWADINNPTVWTPNQITAPFNEAGYFDVRDEIRGMANLGPSQFLVYTTKDTYLFTYYGLPVIWNIQSKVLEDIGIFASYSLVTKENNHYFLGNEGFYQITNSMTPNRIGISKVDIFIINQLQINFPYYMFSFAHPIYPEVCFVYRSKNDTDFKHMLAYNWEKGTWASRMMILSSDVGFPFTAAAEFLKSDTRTMDQITTLPSQTLTWQQKVGSGQLILITGDSQGFLYRHDGLDIDADDTPIRRSLRTWDLHLGDRARNSRLSRIFWDLQDVDFGFRPVSSLVFSKTNANDVYIPRDSFNLDSDSRHDVRAVDKLFQFGIDTTNVPSLSHLVVQAQPAGQRA